MQYLFLDNNRISDLGPLGSMRDLLWLSADFNPITSLAPLGDMRQLETLSVDRRPTAQAEPGVVDVASLKGLEALKSLSLRNQQVASIQSFEWLTNLEYVDLRNNRVSNLESLMSTRLADDSQPGFADVEYAGASFTQVGTWIQNVQPVEATPQSNFEESYHRDYSFAAPSEPLLQPPPPLGHLTIYRLVTMKFG